MWQKEHSEYATDFVSPQVRARLPLGRAQAAFLLSQGA
jgi:hypothetical protein